MAWQTFPAVLDSTQALTRTIVQFNFRREDGAPLDYQAGQFVNIHFEADDKAVHRSYSIATPPGQSRLLEIAISPVEGGRATELLFGLEVGDKIDLSGPYGRFVLRDETPRRLVLAATGTGVTPYRAMLPELTRRLSDSRLQIDLLLGVWRREDLLYGEQFAQFAARHPGFRFHACYSRGMPDTPHSYESAGYVQTHFDELALDPQADLVYLCGNPQMIDDAVAKLREDGFSLKSLRREKYLPARN